MRWLGWTLAAGVGLAACGAPVPSVVAVDADDAVDAPSGPGDVDAEGIAAPDAQDPDAADSDAADDATATDAGSDGAATPLGATGKCPSGVKWKGGHSQSPLMHPGFACITCHTDNQGPPFTIAGTVFQGLHAVDDCNGKPDVTVELTGADGTLTTLVSNAAGNFMLPVEQSQVVFPIHARVRIGTLVREMDGAVPHGDCNHCHTVDGWQGAPGRIVEPL